MHVRHVICVTTWLCNVTYYSWLQNQDTSSTSAYCNVISYSDFRIVFLNQKNQRNSKYGSSMCVLLKASLYEGLHVELNLILHTHVCICFSGNSIFTKNFHRSALHHCKQPRFVQAGFREATGYRFARARKLRGITCSSLQI